MFEWNNVYGKQNLNIVIYHFLLSRKKGEKLIIKNWLVCVHRFFPWFKDDGILLLKNERKRGWLNFCVCAFQKCSTFLVFFLVNPLKVVNALVQLHYPFNIFTTCTNFVISLFYKILNKDFSFPWIKSSYH